MYTHSPDPSTQYAILRKIRGSRDQAIPGYIAPQEQIPWERGCCTNGTFWELQDLKMEQSLPKKRKKKIGTTWCSTLNCNHNKKDNEELSFYRFPKDVNRLV
jgi:hypothetical protein